MQKYIITAIKGNVNSPPPEGDTAAQNATVTVKLKSTGALATIYSDNGSTVMNPPFQTDSNGNFEFYAANGRYIVEVDSRVYDDILLYDKNDEIATQSEAITGTDNEKIMTPLRVGEFCNEFGIGDGEDYNMPTVTNMDDVDRGFFRTDGDNTLNAPFGFASGFFAGYTQKFGVQVLYSIQGGRCAMRGYPSGSYSDWVDFLHQGNLNTFENSSGSSITNNATTSGANLTPSKSGTWRNISGSDLANGETGLFMRIY